MSQTSASPSEQRIEQPTAVALQAVVDLSEDGADALADFADSWADLQPYLLGSDWADIDGLTDADVNTLNESVDALGNAIADGFVTVPDAPTPPANDTEPTSTDSSPDTGSDVAEQEDKSETDEDDSDETNPTSETDSISDDSNDLEDEHESEAENTTETDPDTDPADSENNTDAETGSATEESPQTDTATTEAEATATQAPSSDQTENSASDTDPETTGSTDDDTWTVPSPDEYSRAESVPKPVEDIKVPTKFDVSISKNRLETIITSAKEIAKEGRIWVFDDHLEIGVIDPANVAMIEFPQIDADIFETFDTNPGVLGVEFDVLHSYFDTLKDGSTVTLSLDDSHKLTLTDGTIEWQYATLDPETVREQPDLPPIKADLTATIPRDCLDDVADAGSKVSKILHITTETDSTQLQFNAKGDTDTLDFDPMDRTDNVKIKTADPATSLFSIEWLETTASIMEEAEVVRLDMGDDFPLWINANLAAEDDDISLPVTQVIAPKIKR